MYELIVVTGNVGKAEVLTSRQGNQYVRLSVAVNRPSSSAPSGKITVWYSVLLYSGLAKEPDKIVERYSPGRVVLVEGRPQNSAFIRKDGTADLENCIIASRMPELLDRRPAQPK